MLPAPRPRGEDARPRRVNLLYLFNEQRHLPAADRAPAASPKGLARERVHAGVDGRRSTGLARGSRGPEGSPVCSHAGGTEREVLLARGARRSAVADRSWEHRHVVQPRGMCCAAAGCPPLEARAPRSCSIGGEWKAKEEQGRRVYEDELACGPERVAEESRRRREAFDARLLPLRLLLLLLLLLVLLLLQLAPPSAPSAAPFWCSFSWCFSFSCSFLLLFLPPLLPLQLRLPVLLSLSLQLLLPVLPPQLLLPELLLPEFLPLELLLQLLLLLELLLLLLLLQLHLLLLFLPPLPLWLLLLVLLLLPLQPLLQLPLLLLLLHLLLIVFGCQVRI